MRRERVREVDCMREWRDYREEDAGVREGGGRRMEETINVRGW